MKLLREYIQEMLEEDLDMTILIPPPPSEMDRLRELPLIMHQYHNRYNPDDMQSILDKKMPALFDALLVGAGYPSDLKRIKAAKNDIKPIIKFHKHHYDALRPDELAIKFNRPFNIDHLESAQTPSYPSGHATQAFYLAHILASAYPDLATQFYNVADMIAESRVDRGVHFPSDIAAGKMLASMLVDGATL